jgi:hypothetical protein
MNRGRGRSLWPPLDGSLPILLLWVSWIGVVRQESQSACVLDATLPSHYGTTISDLAIYNQQKQSIKTQCNQQGPSSSDYLTLRSSWSFMHTTAPRSDFEHSHIPLPTQWAPLQAPWPSALCMCAGLPQAQHLAAHTYTLQWLTLSLLTAPGNTELSAAPHRFPGGTLSHCPISSMPFHAIN